MALCCSKSTIKKLTLAELQKVFGPGKKYPNGEWVRRGWIMTHIDDGCSTPSGIIAIRLESDGADFHCAPLTTPFRLENVNDEFCVLMKLEGNTFSLKLDPETVSWPGHMEPSSHTFA